jgi:hypothetical protein
MPIIIIRDSRAAGKQAELRGYTFASDVWPDPVLPNEKDGITINNIMSTPCERTYGHHYENDWFSKLLLDRVGFGIRW